MQAHNSRTNQPQPSRACRTRSARLMQTVSGWTGAACDYAVDMFTLVGACQCKQKTQGPCQGRPQCLPARAAVHDDSKQSLAFVRQLQGALVGAAIRSSRTARPAAYFNADDRHSISYGSSCCKHNCESTGSPYWLWLTTSSCLPSQQPPARAAAAAAALR